MALNTRIRGAQIVLSDEAIAVADDKLAFIDADGVMKQESVADLATAMAGNGIEASSGVFALDLKASGGLKFDGVEVAVEPADFAGDGLKDDGADNLALDLNELTEAGVDVGEDYIVFVDMDTGDLGSKKESIADLVSAMAGSGLTATDGVLSVDSITDNIVEGDIVVENLSADIDASGYAGEHTLANEPLTNSVQVFLNGLLQEEGSGKDYTIGGTGSKTITFATAPVSGDIVIVHYIKNN